MKKGIQIRYWLSLFLSLMCTFMIADTVMAFPYDLYGVLMGQFINIPLGIVSIVVSAMIQIKEANRRKWKTYITLAGIIFGLITAILPIVLFKIGMM